MTTKYGSQVPGVTAVKISQISQTALSKHNACLRRSALALKVRKDFELLSGLWK